MNTPHTPTPVAPVTPSRVQELACYPIGDDAGLPNKVFLQLVADRILDDIRDETFVGGTGGPADTFEITVTAKFDAGFLLDVMTTMVESAYEWFGFSKVVRLPSDHATHGLCITSFVAHEIDCDGTGKTISRKAIDAAAVVKALQRIVAGDLTHSSNTDLIIAACANNDASNIDMDIADCILQVACFGEVRYG